MPPASPGPDRRIDVVGLGPAGFDLITTGARAAIEGALAEGAGAGPSAAGPSPDDPGDVRPGEGGPVARFVRFRTGRHPAASAFPAVPTYDATYESAATFDEVYASIVADLIALARSAPRTAVVYGVPGAPTVAERTVTLLLGHPAVRTGEVAVTVHPALSFADLAFARLGVDPIDAGVRLVDGERFATEGAGERGPLLVGQCWSRHVLSEMKVLGEPEPGATVTILHHLGLDDEVVTEVPWEEMDRTVEPDHLTSVWIPAMAPPVGAELARLDELVRTLRAECPWDREQSHASLARHLLEEAYELLEAIDAVAAIDATGATGDGATGDGATGDGAAGDGATGDGAAGDGAAGDGAAGDGAAGGAAGPGAAAEPDARVGELDAAGDDAVAHLEEELGDVLFQVYFHATLAAEAGRFTLADVARGVREKLIARHPHVFGDAVAATASDVMANWEVAKLEEKGRASVTDGIPAALPALATVAKLQRKAAAIGLDVHGLAGTPGLAGRQGVLGVRGDEASVGPPGSPPPGSDAAAAVVADLLFDAVQLARDLGIDPEQALRTKAVAFRAAIVAAESAT